MPPSLRLPLYFTAPSSLICSPITVLHTQTWTITITVLLSVRLWIAQHRKESQSVCWAEKKKEEEKRRSWGHGSNPLDGEQIRRSVEKSNQWQWTSETLVWMGEWQSNQVVQKEGGKNKEIIMSIRCIGFEKCVPRRGLREFPRCKIPQYNMCFALFSSVPLSVGAPFKTSCSESDN